ncbi:hypothetical protein [Stenotrophomonas maltophilia]|uniref:hypothetical protein n=2 Tax=Gammaproteobacteria TaxID=1236 RepID=UPI00066EB223|nr:hypothetical protein [Stenotrophomonas maltophilia]ELK2665650.1 hypothetical protein [Stenotrophomonas maltophilia]MBB5529478.1 hypothetical protein [Stenotrophomonas maltophilia]MBH1376529.1 hypothetical protein [Stenotrophomonas maltophilia]MBH1439624.1 hypothetical protein [Stenotrophomonas maltophilia]MBH1560655.1 hypothetical protein [Stenotrophomonas maltophilia]
MKSIPLEKNMNMTSRNHKRQRGLRQKRLAAILLGSMVMFSTTSVSAGGYPVIDFSNLAQALKDVAQGKAQLKADGLEYAAQVDRWRRTFQEYQNALVQIQGMINNFGLPPGATLERVPDDYMVADLCRTSAGFSAGSLLKKFVLDTSGDLYAQQQQLCVNIQMMENRKRNETVDFIEKTIPSVNASLAKIMGWRGGANGNLAGTLSAVNSDSLRTANDIAKLQQEWEARMRSYDAYQESMMANQRVLARVALKGKPGVISQLVKTAALERALHVD